MGLLGQPHITNIIGRWGPLSLRILPGPYPVRTQRYVYNRSAAIVKKMGIGHGSVFWREKAMPSCERCWSDAGGDADLYAELLIERRDDPCSPEDQAGPGAGVCPDCGRRTVHQYVAGFCMNCQDFARAPTRCV